MSTRWDQVWASRRLPPPTTGTTLLRRRLDADGFDSGFAGVDEENWVRMTD
jgi:hypothetical protein